MNPDIGGLVQRSIGFGDRYRRQNLEDERKSQVAQAEAEKNRMIQESLGGAFQQAPTYGGGDTPLWGGGQPQVLGAAPQQVLGGQQAAPGQTQDPNQGMGQYRQMIQQQAQDEGGTQEQALRNLFTIDPSLGKKALEGIDLMDKRANKQAADWAFRMENLQPQQQQQEIMKRADEITARGGNPNNTLGLMNLTPENRKFALKNMQVAALSNQERIERMDVKEAAAAKKSGKGATGAQVQSSKILPGGLVQMVMKDGTIKTVSPEEANVELIKEAEERGAELQGLRAGERGAAAESIKIAAQSFKTLGAVRKNIRNMDEGIKLLEEGASTGRVQSMMPSFRAASVKLDNLKGRLGMDVLGAVTFGALSAGELKFALDTALPTGLRPNELKDWMIEKREAQNKVATNLEEAALYLGTPGNTTAEFIKMKRDEKESESQADALTPEEQAELEQLRSKFGR